MLLYKIWGRKDNVCALLIVRYEPCRVDHARDYTNIYVSTMQHVQVLFIYRAQLTVLNRLVLIFEGPVA